MTHLTRDDALKALERIEGAAMHMNKIHLSLFDPLRAFIEGEPVKNVDAARQLLKNADNFTERENSSQYGKKTPEIYRAVNNSLPAIEGLDEAIDEAEFELFEGPTWVTLASGNAEALCKAARAYQQMQKQAGGEL